MDRINCDVCRRPHSQKLPFLCVTDARNQLYESRLQNAKLLIENDILEHQINAIVSPPQDVARQEDSAVKAQLVQSWKSEQAAALDRTSQIIAQAERLRLESDAARKELQDRKESVRRRKSDLVSVSEGIAARRSRQIEDIERSIHMSNYKWNRSADQMCATRAFLCEEAARLYGLRQVRKGASKRYEIGGVEIIELHAMNGLSPEVISTSLGHIAHILVLASHYLSIRLPAEVTLPHRDYPRPTVFTLSSSYRHEDVPFPGSSLPQHLSSETRSGGSNGQHTPRPRPLFVDKPLPLLAKEDPPTYALFLEGVTLLAYDIAWVCSTQGVSIGDRNSYDDVCNMGQNLWRLMIGDQLIRKSVEPTFPNAAVLPTRSPSDDKIGGAGSAAAAGVAKTQIGRWSHGTTHSFLGGAEGSEFIRNFKLLAPIKLADRLKKKLSSEAPMLEWEKIDGDEARAGENNDHGTIGIEESGFANSRTTAAAAAAGGLNGWTKLKNRTS